MQVVSEQEWVVGEYLDVATVNLGVQAIADQNGFRIMVWDEDGLGEARGQLLKTATGTQFIVRQLVQAPAPYNRQTSVLCLGYLGDAKTISEATKMTPEHMQADLTEALQELGIGTPDLYWVHEDLDAEAIRARLPSVPLSDRVTTTTAPTPHI
jgi:hypothetical protein